MTKRSPVDLVSPHKVVAHGRYRRTMVEPLIEHRLLKRLRVTELKELLEQRRLSTEGIKDELVARLEEARSAEEGGGAEPAVGTPAAEGEDAGVAPASVTISPKRPVPAPTSRTALPFTSQCCRARPRRLSATRTRAYRRSRGRNRPPTSRTRPGPPPWAS